jgi:hypothetical protein
MTGHECDPFTALGQERGWLTLYAVRDLISRRVLGNNPIPPGMHRFCHDLEVASVRGSKDVVAQAKWEPEELIDTAEAAAILQCSARWVRQIRTDLEGRNVSGRWVFRRQNVVDYADMKGGSQ